jgi:hypothetical protein
MSLNNAKIENSFNNIIINFSERNSHKINPMNTLHPRNGNEKLVFERKARSKDFDRIVEGRRYMKSKVLSEREA